MSKRQGTHKDEIDQAAAAGWQQARYNLLKIDPLTNKSVKQGSLGFGLLVINHILTQQAENGTR